jgi:hypothetical protein
VEASKVDFIGDVHGQLRTLMQLGEHLGYDVEHGWSHPDDRVLVFLGDLLDRGEDSLGVVRLAKELVESGRACCLMGNHEYNLVGYAKGLFKPKQSNRSTIADLQQRPKRWAPVIDFLGRLPMAVEFPALRAIHAVWHRECFAKIEQALAVSSDFPIPGADAVRRAGGKPVLASPFVERGLAPGLTAEEIPPGGDKPHEILIKGFETPAPEPFTDNDGKKRDLIRVPWWEGPHPAVAQDKLTIFGHYWNVPPIPGKHEGFAPPHPSGHPKLRAWQADLSSAVPEVGLADVPGNVRFACVDYNSIDERAAGGCVGAFRWPERQVAWARLAMNANRLGD